MDKYRLLHELSGRPLAMHVDAANGLMASVQAGSEAALQALAPTRNPVVLGGVAVVPVIGPLVHRDSLLAQIFGYASYQRLAEDITRLSHEPGVKTLVLDVDSPGGYVSGVDEAADALYDARSRVRTVAIANTIMASAAYWIGSQAQEVVSAQTALVGSIGVLAVHAEFSRALESEGINVTVLRTPAHKAEGNPYEPLTDEAREHMQGIIDSSYAMFTKAVARGRGVPEKTVRSTYGEGRVLTAQAAKAAGMVDRVASLNDTLRRAMPRDAGMRAEDVVTLRQAEGFLRDGAGLSQSEAKTFLARISNLLRDGAGDPPRDVEAETAEVRQALNALNLSITGALHNESRTEGTGRGHPG